MARYIDVEKAVNFIDKEGLKLDTYGKLIVYIFEHFEAADVKPVVHAHWDMTKTKADHNEPPFCSNCGKAGLFSRYCPNCGAKMDEEVEHD